MFSKIYDRFDKRTENDFNYNIKSMEDEFYKASGKRVNIITLEGWEELTDKEQVLLYDMQTKENNRVRSHNRKMGKLAMAVGSILFLSLVFYFYSEAEASLWVHFTIGAILFYIVYREDKGYRRDG